MVPLTSDHLGRCIAGTAAGCLERRTRLVCIAESEIDDFDVHVVIEEKVLRFQVTMHDIKFVEVLDTGNDLVEKLQSLRLLNSLVLHDKVKELTLTRVLHDEVELLGSFDNLIQLDDVWVSNHFEDMNFSCYSLNIVHILNLVFLENFYRNPLIGERMHTQLYLTERALPDRLIYTRNELSFTGDG